MTTPRPTHEVISHIDPAFSDERGDITNVITDMDFSHIAVITTVSGSTRGNHIHPGEQWMYLISGGYISYSGEEGSEPEAQEVVPGDLVYCPPDVAHAYFFTKDSVFLNITNDNRDQKRFAEHTRKVAVL